MKTLVTIMAVVMMMFSVQAMAVDINGGSSWGGWTLEGQSDALGIYGIGPTANPYNIYTTVFAYSGNPVTGSPAGGAGQAAAGVFGGGFSNGDLVIGVGVDMLGGESVANFLPTLKFDLGNNSYTPSTTLLGGGNGHVSGSTYANAGDFNMNANVNNGWRPGDLAIYNGLGGNKSGGVINILNIPLASFAQTDSYQLFVNLSTISSFAASNGYTTPIPTFGSDLTLALNGYSTNQVVIGATVPEPCTMALLGLGGLLFARKKK